MSDGVENMPLDRAARLLRAKAHELENLARGDEYHLGDIDYLRADVALVAELCALALDRVAALEDAGHSAMTGLATLYFSWEELDALAGLVDERIGDWPTVAPGWPMLNSLRTALREAQGGLPHYAKAPHPHDDPEAGRLGDVPPAPRHFDEDVDHH